MSKLFRIHYWDRFCNGHFEEIKAKNQYKAEYKFYKIHPYYFVVKIEEIESK